MLPMVGRNLVTMRKRPRSVWIAVSIVLLSCVSVLSPVRAADLPATVTTCGDLSRPVSAFDELRAVLARRGFDNDVAQSLENLFVEFDGIFDPIKPGDRLAAVIDIGPATTSAGRLQPRVRAVSFTHGGMMRAIYAVPDDGVRTVFVDDRGAPMPRLLTRRPVVGGILCQPFGSVRNPILDTIHQHPGVDWDAPEGTAVLAAGDGVVAALGYASGPGWFVSIRHAAGLETTYAHLSGPAKVVVGQTVEQGDTVGTVGRSGATTRPEVLVEVSRHGLFIDPLSSLSPSPSRLAPQQWRTFLTERASLDRMLRQESAKLWP